MSKRNQLIEKALHHHRCDEDQKAIEILDSEELSECDEAMLLLGQIYYRAHKSITGVSRSYPKARKYWLKALELGNSEAARELADMYYFGEGVKENMKKAEFYWQQAAEANDEMAQFALANYYYDDLNEKIDEAIRLYQQLIARDEFTGNCYLKLGRIYYRGLGVEKNIAQAIDWFEKGVKAGDANSCMDLAYMYYRGEGVKQDTDKAISLVEKAGESEWLKDDAPRVIKLMREGRQFLDEEHDEEDIDNGIYSADMYTNISDEDDDDYEDDIPADKLRSAVEIARRALALSAVISCAYGDAKKPVIDWLKQEDLWRAVSPEERKFLNGKSTEKAEVALSWRIEALVPLLWAINKIKKMPGINKQCDTEPLKKAVVWSPASTKDYIATSRLRDEDEISREYEKVYQAHWTVRDAQLNNKPVPKKYDPEVIMERHHAFNWLIGYMGQAWDDITTDT